jgi:hypothetical protein
LCSISVVDNAPFLAVVKYACEEVRALCHRNHTLIVFFLIATMFIVVCRFQFKVKFETSAVISPGSD